MDNLFKNLFGVPFYRLFFSAILGFIGIGIFFFIFQVNLTSIFNIEQSLISTIINNTKDIPITIWIIFFFLCFFIGEIYALMGEGILNIFFDYNPLRKNNPNNQVENDCFIERTNPFSNNYLRFRDFKKFKDETLEGMSQVHYELGRIIGGFALLIFLLGLKISQNNIFIITVYIIIVISGFYFLKIADKIIIFQFLTTIIINSVILIYPTNKINIECNNCLMTILLLTISFFMFVCAASYRSFANNILKHSTKP
jgi:hypothetical protein